MLYGVVVMVWDDGTVVKAQLGCGRVLDLSKTWLGGSNRWQASARNALCGCCMTISPSSYGGACPEVHRGSTRELCPR